MSIFTCTIGHFADFFVAGAITAVVVIVVGALLMVRR